MGPDQIGICVDVLFHKKWGKTPINGQLKSQSWWERRLKALIEAPAIEIKTPWEPCPAEPAPIPYEIEMKLGEPNEKRND